MKGGFGGSGRYNPGNNPLLLLVTALIGVVFLGSAAYFFYSKDKSEPGIPVSTDLSSVDVLVPIDKIEAGVPLEATLFRKESRPAAGLPASVIKDFNQIKGYYSASFIIPNQPLLAEYITNKRPVNQLQANIPEGFRAVTVNVDPTTSVEGWARPGAKVDVVLGSVVAGRPSVTVVVQNAKVLSADRQMGAAGGNTGGVPATVTLLVTAEDAAKIQLASNSGILSLELKGDEDAMQSPQTSTITLDSILGSPSDPTPASVPTEGSITIDGKQFMIQGGKLIPFDGKADKK